MELETFGHRDVNDVPEAGSELLPYWHPMVGHLIATHRSWSRTVFMLDYEDLWAVAWDRYKRHEEVDLMERILESFRTTTQFTCETEVNMYGDSPGAPAYGAVYMPDQSKVLFGWDWWNKVPDEEVGPPTYIFQWSDYEDYNQDWIVLERKDVTIESCVAALTHLVSKHYGQAI